MFKTKEKSVVELDTIIGESTTFNGTIESKGNLRIDGTITGDLLIEGDITIGHNGKIKGNIVCDNLIIAGLIEGNVNCREQLRIASNGRLIGDIDVKSFVVDEDAIFRGKSNMKDKKVLALTDSTEKNETGKLSFN